MFWHAIDCVAVPANFECVYSGFDHICEREIEKRSSVEELLALPDSSLVSVINFDCQLAFRNANGEKQSIHSNSITFLQSQMYQRINLAQKTACPGKYEICRQ